MSFLVDDATCDLVRNLWPKEFKRFGDDPDAFADCDAWQAVPNDPVDISEWLQIVRKAQPVDPARPFVVTNAGDLEDQDSEFYEVSLRIQGFLVYASLGALGNWDGKEHSVPRATQTVVLGSGGYDAEWVATLRAINRLVTVVAKLAQPDKPAVSPYKEVPAEQVVFKRRVFVKATEGAGRIPKEAGHRADELRRVMDRWHLDGALEFGQLGRDGKGRRVTQVVFNKGHFVDVTATIEIIASKSADAPVTVQLKPGRIVLVGTEGVRKGRAAAKIQDIKISKRAAPVLEEGWAEYEEEYIPSALYPSFDLEEHGPVDGADDAVDEEPADRPMDTRA